MKLELILSSIQTLRTGIEEHISDRSRFFVDFEGMAGKDDSLRNDAFQRGWEAGSSGNKFQWTRRGHAIAVVR